MAEQSTVGRTRPRKRRYLGAIGVALATAAGLLIANPLTSSADQSFTTVGAATYTVTNANTARIRIVAIGADGVATEVPGGNGARVEATVDASPGEVLNVRVGTGGGAGGAAALLAGNGGTGGGLSGVLRGTTPLVIAGGGGGAGGNQALNPPLPILPPGEGGEAPLPGSVIGATGGCAPAEDGEAGTLAPVTGGQGGGGGQCNGGGAGGATLVPGNAGSSLAGGDGGGGAVASGGGGGGGGGYFGGGGGGAGLALGGGGGGGGGSSFVAGGASGVSLATNGGAVSAPSVEIFELVAECADGADNDDPEDTLADAADPGCHTDGNAANPLSYDSSDNDESDTSGPGAVAECNDNVDNADPEDTLVDEDDPGCHSDNDPNNPASYFPLDDDETDPGSPGQNTTECNNNVDDDDPEDTLIDEDDPGCHVNDDLAQPYNPNDLSETDGVPSPQCSDGIDNADPEDTLADDDDPGCHTDGNAANTNSYNPFDNNEVDGDGDGTGGEGTITDLTLTLHASKSRTRAGKLVGFTVTVRNNGPAAASNLVITTTLDKGRLVFRDLTGNGCNAPAPSSSVVVCRIASLAVGQSSNFTIEAKTKGHGKAKVTSFVEFNGVDLAPSDNKDRETVRVSPRRHRR